MSAPSPERPQDFSRRRDVEATNYTDPRPDPEAANYQLPPRPTDPQATNYSPSQTTSDLHSPAPAAGAGRKLPCNFGGYELLEEIGRGGMGVVYKARQLGLDRVVAVKMVLAGAHAGADERKRFRTEAEAIARLAHANIIQIHEVGECEGHAFLSLEYCAGGSLDRKLAGVPLPPKEAAALVEVLARAMQAAHDVHVVHRDLKPANVLLTTAGQAKVTDFGLAKKLDDVGHTASGVIMGSAPYMAPEQARGLTREIGPATDVYALGAILYECLTGRPPFRAATDMETLLQVMGNEPLRPTLVQPQVPRDLETICLKCLAKEQGKRYGSARELADDQGRYLRGEPIKARPMGAIGRAVRWARRQPAQAGLLALVVLALLGVIAGSLVFAWQADQRRLGAEEYAKKEEGLRKEADAARNDLQRSNDELLTSVARRLLGPLGSELSEKGVPILGLTDPEVESLWELVASPLELLRQRFVKSAVLGPVTMRQLKNRAAFTMHAAVGLGLHRREVIEQIVVEQMSVAALPRERRTDLALTLVGLGDLSPRAASSAFGVFTEVISKATERDGVQAAAGGISKVAARLGNREASDAAMALTEAISKATDVDRLLAWVEVQSVVAARLGPGEARLERIERPQWSWRSPSGRPRKWIGCGDWRVGYR
jgi:hypothetical protein